MSQDLGGLGSLVTGSTHEDGPGTLVLLLLKGIGLSSEQKQQVRAIFIAHHECFEMSFRELQEAQAALSKTLFAAEDISTNDVAPHAQRVTQLR